MIMNQLISTEHPNTIPKRFTLISHHSSIILKVSVIQRHSSNINFFSKNTIQVKSLNSSCTLLEWGDFTYLRHGLCRTVWSAETSLSGSSLSSSSVMDELIRRVDRTGSSSVELNDAVAAGVFLLSPLVSEGL